MKRLLATATGVALLALTGCQDHPRTDVPVLVTTEDNYVLDVPSGVRWDVQYEDDQPDPQGTCDHSGGHFDTTTWICQDIDY